MANHHTGHSGSSMTSMEESPERKKRRQRNRRRQEKRWASMQSEVTVSYLPGWGPNGKIEDEDGTVD